MLARPILHIMGVEHQPGIAANRFADDFVEAFFIEPAIVELDGEKLRAVGFACVEAVPHTPAVGKAPGRQRLLRKADGAVRVGEADRLGAWIDGVGANTSVLGANIDVKGVPALNGTKLRPWDVKLVNGTEVGLVGFVQSDIATISDLPDGAVPLDGTTPASEKFASLTSALAAQRPHPAPVNVIVQGSAEQRRFFSRLFADGYEGFMLNLQSRVALKL